MAVRSRPRRENRACCRDAKVQSTLRCACRWNRDSVVARPFHSAACVAAEVRPARQVSRERDRDACGCREISWSVNASDWSMSYPAQAAKKGKKEWDETPLPIKPFTTNGVRFRPAVIITGALVSEGS